MVKGGLIMVGFHTDLSIPENFPRIRFDFDNGWTASVVVSTTNGFDATMASLACWPTDDGKSQRRIELGDPEASPDEVAEYIRDVSNRHVVRPL